MKWDKEKVGLGIATIFVAIFVWDVWLYTDDIPDNSISQVIISATAASPLVAWFVGLIMGGLSVHWFETPKGK